MLFRTRTRRPSRPAVAATEFALLSPLLVTLLLGVWELGQQIRMYQLVANAAREGLRQAATAKYTNEQVRSAVFEYLTRSGVPLSDTLPAASVTLTNMNATISVTVANATGEAFDADQFVPMSVTVSVPSKNCRWLLSNLFLSASSNLAVTAAGMCLKDVPITVDSVIPQAPLQ